MQDTKLGRERELKKAGSEGSVNDGLALQTESGTLCI